MLGATGKGQKESGGGGKKKLPVFKCVCFRCDCQKEFEEEGNLCWKCMVVCYWFNHPPRKLKRSRSWPGAAGEL
ncbi:hypothetical protein B0T21DRAFT_288435 [Apiosordaria backusii]|uniref:Uncharacterized protein n=1 Tax=Apiosordaria backusii TaxID=314023 RepID=A0AA40BKX8_9PEZI|nr:hypothetical protein B0T21DRAFT_288435 [Apiosordaria backusii]